MTALDANHDGILDADEIANATAALKTLDKNGDGQLTPDEFAPGHRPGVAGNEGQRRPGFRSGPAGAPGARGNLPPTNE